MLLLVVNREVLEDRTTNYVLYIYCRRMSESVSEALAQAVPVRAPEQSVLCSIGPTLAVHAPWAYSSAHAVEVVLETPMTRGPESYGMTRPPWGPCG